MITCPRCGATSHHPDDVREGYCGRCHWWTSCPLLGQPEVIAQAERDGAIEPAPPCTCSPPGGGCEWDRQPCPREAFCEARWDAKRRELV